MYACGKRDFAMMNGVGMRLGKVGVGCGNVENQKNAKALGSEAGLPIEGLAHHLAVIAPRYLVSVRDESSLGVF